LHEGIRDALHRYIAGVLMKRGCRPNLINSVDDHVHALFELGRTVALSDVVEAVKRSSSRWIKTQGAEFAGFSWQSGYGAFAVSESNVGRVRRYVAEQREHHRKRSFEDEYRAILERHGVEFDERRLWD
jgi:REP element-mobilizing transposase RayT